MKVINLETFTIAYQTIYRTFFNEKELHKWAYHLRTTLRINPVKEGEIFYLYSNIYNYNGNHLEKISFKFKMIKGYTIEYLNYN